MGQKETHGVMFCDQSDLTILFEKKIQTSIVIVNIITKNKKYNTKQGT